MPDTPHATLFIYGTLKQGWGLAHLMEGQEFLGIARTAPLYRIYNTGSYPGLVDSPENGLSIEGELWRVEGDRLANLDAVEGAGEGYYDRRPITLLPPLSPATAQAYFYLKPTGGLPDCGTKW